MQLCGEQLIAAATTTTAAMLLRGVSGWSRLAERRRRLAPHFACCPPAPSPPNVCVCACMCTCTRVCVRSAFAFLPGPSLSLSLSLLFPLCLSLARVRGVSDCPWLRGGGGRWCRSGRIHLPSSPLSLSLLLLSHRVRNFAGACAAFSPPLCSARIPLFKYRERATCALLLLQLLAPRSSRRSSVESAMTRPASDAH